MKLCISHLYKIDCINFSINTVLEFYSEGIVVFCFLSIILYSLYLKYESLFIPSTSGLAGETGELHTCFLVSPSDKTICLQAVGKLKGKR